MESVYADEFINIIYYKNSDTLSAIWNNCERTAHYNASLLTFKSYFNNIKPKNILWNNQKLDFKFCEDLQKRASTFFDEESLKQGINEKIAMVLDENLYTKFRLSNLYKELYGDIKLRYFNHQQNALDWIDTPFWAEEASIIPKIKIKDMGEDGYNIAVNVKKSEFHEYVSMLSHLLKNRDFCLRNIENFNSLTGREREILLYIVKGFKNNDIADYLYLSVETIKTHRKNILTKLNSPNIYNLSQYLMFFKE